MRLLVNRSLKRVLALFLAVVALFCVLGMNSPVSRIVTAEEYSGKGIFKQCTDNTLVSGYYVFGVGTSADSISAVNTTQTNNWIKFTTTKPGDGVITNPNTSIVWYYNATTGKFNNGTNYVAWTSTGNSGGLNDTGTPLTVTETATDGVYNITVTATPARVLRLNGTSGYRFYTSNTGTATFYFFKLDESAHTHSPNGETETVKATCTTAGSISYTCSCGELVNEQTDEALGHDYVYETLQSATCQVVGSRKITCSRCDYNETGVITKTSHIWDEKNECTACGATATAYVKVTEELTDWSGRYLIVYEDDARVFDGGRDSTNIDGAGNYQEVTLVDNQIAGDVDQYAFTIAKVDGGYSVQTQAGLYIGSTAANDNIIEKSEEFNADLLNTITYEDEAVKITGIAGTFIQYYKSGNNSRFRYYQTSQKAIALYRLEGEILTTEEKFERQATQANLKFVGDEAYVRFGMELDEDIYTALEAKDATFKITVNGQDFSQAGFNPVAIEENGVTKYHYWVVFSGIADYPTNELKAKVCVTVDGVTYAMAEIVTTGKLLAESYATDSLNEAQFAVITAMKSATVEAE